MTQCVEQLPLGILRGERLTGGFDGGDISSDGGLVLLAQADRRLGPTRQLAACLHDGRQPGKVRHRLDELLAQRVYQIAAGYEDCNDADDLRHDPVLKTVVGRLPQSGPEVYVALAVSSRASLTTSGLGVTELGPAAAKLPSPRLRGRLPVGAALVSPPCVRQVGCRAPVGRNCEYVPVRGLGANTEVGDAGITRAPGRLGVVAGGDAYLAAHDEGAIGVRRREEAQFAREPEGQPVAVVALGACPGN